MSSVARTSDNSISCKTLYFTPTCEHELTLKADLQTGFHSIDFSAEWRLVDRGFLIRYIFEKQEAKPQVSLTAPNCEHFE